MRDLTSSCVADKLFRHQQVVDLVNAPEHALPSEILDKFLHLEKGGKNISHIKRSLMVIGLSDVLDRYRHGIKRALKKNGALKEMMVAQEAEKNQRQDEKRFADDARVTYAKSILAQWRLDDGSPLGEASVSYLNELSELEDDKARGHKKVSVFYKKLTKDLPNDAVIKEHISIERAEIIRLQVFG